MIRNIPKAIFHLLEGDYTAIAPEGVPVVFREDFDDRLRDRPCLTYKNGLLVVSRESGAISPI